MATSNGTLGSGDNGNDKATGLSFGVGGSAPAPGAPGPPVAGAFNFGSNTVATQPFGFGGTATTDFGTNSSASSGFSFGPSSSGFNAKNSSSEAEQSSTLAPFSFSKGAAPASGSNTAATPAPVSFVTDSISKPAATPAPVSFVTGSISKPAGDSASFSFGTSTISSQLQTTDTNSGSFGFGAPAKQSEGDPLNSAGEGFELRGSTSASNNVEDSSLLAASTPSVSFGRGSSAKRSGGEDSVSGGFGGPTFAGDNNKKTPAPSTGGLFSLGASSTSNAKPGDQVQTPGLPTTAFGFNSGTSTPASTSTVPQTPGPPAPVATPGPLTATPGQQSAQTPSSSTQAVIPSSYSNTPAPLEYQTLSVEQILNKFQKELEKDALLYLEEAKRVAEYDAILRDAQRDIASLTQKTHRCLLQQKDVEQTLTGVGAFQLELDRTLEIVENNIDELFKSQAHFIAADADIEREKAYKTAGDVELRLQDLTATLKTTLDDMEAAQERVLSGDLGKIVKILNQHQNSLAELEDAGRRMEQDIMHVNRLLEQR